MLTMLVVLSSAILERGTDENLMTSFSDYLWSFWVFILGRHEIDRLALSLSLDHP